MRARGVAALLVGWVLLALPVPARAEIPQDLLGKPVTALEVSGDRAPASVLRDADIALGTRLDRPLLRKAIFGLLASGLWVDVQIDAVAAPGGVKLVFELQHRILLNRISIRGNEGVESQIILDALRVSKGSEIADGQLEGLSRAVGRAYADRGYLGAEISVSLRDTDEPALKVLMLDIIEGKPTRIREIRFRGGQPYDSVALLAAMQTRIGDVLDRRELTRAVERGGLYLRQRGYLQADLGTPLITVEGTRARVAIPSTIGPRYELFIRNSFPLSRGDVDAELKLREQPLTRAMIATTISERITDLYARHGFFDTRVYVERVLGQDPTTAGLLVHVEPGRQLRVVAVSFAGARHFDRDFLRDQLFSYLEEDLPGSSITSPVDSEVVDDIHQGGAAPRRGRSVPKPLINDPVQTYYESTYKEAIRHITELYHAHGYLSAKVGPATLRRIGKERAAIAIPVVEGPRTLLHQVVLVGTELVTARALLSASNLERNTAFSYLRLEEARLRMLNLYHERGHMFARVEPTVRFSQDRTRAEVTVQVVERFAVHVDRIVIRGANRTSHGLIKKLVQFEPGDIFRPSLARQSEDELQSLGVFTGVSVGLQDSDLPARVKSLVVTVSERKNQFLDFSAGVSTGQGVRAGFEYGYRNLFGYGVGLTLRVQFAHQLFFVQDELRDRFESLSLADRLERRVSLGTVIPRTPGLGRIRTAIDLAHIRDNERDFGLDKNGVSLTFTHTWMKRVTLTVGGDLENNNVDLFVSEQLNDYLAATDDPRLRRLLRVPEGNSTLVAGRSSLSYDRRDSPFIPTKGYFASTTAELARTLSTDTPQELQATNDFVSRFLKLTASSTGYVPMGRSVVLAGLVRVGRVVHLSDNSKTYPNRAFFLGGVDTMRGYFQDSMIPQDIAEEILSDPELSPNSIVRAGDAFALLRGELRFPIYGQLRGGLFTDMGNLWADAANLNPFELRPTSGLGLRLATPVGPIAVDYGIILKRRRALGEPFGTLHFSIGLF